MTDTKNHKRNIAAHVRWSIGCSMLAIAPLLAATPAGAQQAAAAEAATSDDIVVTARFREETLQDVSGSIAAYDGAEIARSGLVDVSDLSARVVGMSLIKTAPNANEINIRGITNARPGGSGVSSLVTVMLDDVVVSGSGGGTQRDFNLFDFDRVEVLRGAQPTYFGEGSVGGTIRYFPQDPDLSGGFSAVANAGVGSIKSGGTSYRAEAGITVPLVKDVLALRLVGFYRDEGGFIDLFRLGIKDANTYESAGGRAILVYEPTDRLRVRLSAHIARDTIGDSNQIDPARDLTPIGSDDLVSPVSSTSRTEDDFDLYTANIRYQPNDWLTVQSITGNYTRDTAGATESTGNTLGFRNFLARFGVTNVDTTTIQQSITALKNFSQEFRFVSDLDGPINFIAGAYYRDGKTTSRIILGGPGFTAVTTPSTTEIQNLTSRTDSRQISAFAELTGTLSDRMRLIGGLRYVHQDDTVTLVSSTAIAIFGFNPTTLRFPINNDLNTLTGLGLGNRFEFDLREFLPRLGLEYDLTDDAMLYANAARGLRNGGLNSVLSSVFVGLNTDGTLDQGRFIDALRYSEDKVDTYEIGAKTRWLDDALTFNVALHYTEYKDPQIVVGVPTFLLTNGPKERIWGVDLESSYRFSKNWSAFFNLGWLDAKFTEGQSLLPIAGAPTGFQDLADGNRPTNAPKWSISTGTDLSLPLTDSLSIIGHADFAYVSERFGSVQNFPSTRLGSLELVNLRLGVEGSFWSITGYVTNLLNDLELQGALAPTNGASLVNGQLNSAVSQVFVNQPRTIGVNLGLRF